MFVGQFGVGLAAKATPPRTPPGLLVARVYGVDRRREASSPTGAAASVEAP